MKNHCSSLASAAARATTIMVPVAPMSWRAEASTDLP
eukprot:CAMPEP_0119332612 /NCGR_PEP_ID=MMETSP1333-20130426/83176_1 /TAXON_ID=418940 /ORGANISM="Scyphosphaera apsteinii, Strain RCC1455" /LENGTH=36 /DNA_ID= /DNA_START= /DNA_END= /DNA_ORIENTATION=